MRATCPFPAVPATLVGAPGVQPSSVWPLQSSSTLLQASLAPGWIELLESLQSTDEQKPSVSLSDSLLLEQVAGAKVPV